MTEAKGGQKRRFRTRLIAAVSVGLFGCCGGLLAFGDRPHNGIRVENLEKDLNERLPDGSTWDEAEAWFAAHGIKPHSISRVSDGNKVGLGATVPNNSFVNSAEIRIALFFNAQSRLEKRIVYRFIYSV